MRLPCGPMMALTQASGQHSCPEGLVQVFVLLDLSSKDVPDVDPPLGFFDPLRPLRGLSIRSHALPMQPAQQPASDTPTNPTATNMFVYAA